MKTLTGRIFLNEQHGSSFFQQEEDAFYGLQFFSDERLAPSDRKAFEVPSNIAVILLPITGDLIYEDCDGVLEVNIGQLLLINNPSAYRFEACNPFTGHQINYLLFYLNSDNIQYLNKEVLNFNVNDGINKFISVAKTLTTCLSIGHFSGRKEIQYPLANPGFFCFVLVGAFEVEGRLLHAKDGLTLWNIQQVEIEALSNNAVLLALELT